MAFKGREVLIEVDTGSGFVPVGKLQSKSLSINKESIDITGVDSGDWKELDPRGLGMTSISITGSGVYDDSDAVQEFIEDAVISGALLTMKFTFGPGDSYSGTFKVTSFDRSGDSAGAIPFTISAEGSGAIVLTRFSSGDAGASGGGGDYVCVVVVNCTPIATWTASANSSNISGDGIWWAGDKFVIAGGNKILSTVDGVSLTTEATIAGSPNLTSLCSDGTLFVAGALDGASRIYTSTDLATWTGRTITGSDWTQDTDTGVKAVKYFVGIGWVAVGTSYSAGEWYASIAYSADGLTWTTPYTFSTYAGTAYDLTWDGTTITVVGNVSDGGFEVSYPFIIQSTDGTSWTITDMAIISSDAEFYAIDYNCTTGVYVIAGWNEVLRTSDDFVSMSNIALGKVFSSMYYSNYYGRWVCGTDDGFIYWSTDDGVTFGFSYNTGGGSNLDIRSINDDHGVNATSVYLSVGRAITAVNGSWYNNCT